MAEVDVWLPAPEKQTYNPATFNNDNVVGNAVRIGDRIVGHVEEVLEVRPDGVKIRLSLKGERLPTVDEVSK